MGQRRFVEIRGRVDAAQTAEQRRYLEPLRADADRVDAQSHLRGELRRLDGIDFAGRVGAIGQQDQHLLARVGRLIVDALDGQRNRVADCGLLPRQPDLRFHQ